LGVFFALFLLQHGYIIPLFNIFAVNRNSLFYSTMECFMLEWNFSWVWQTYSLVSDLGTGSPTCGWAI